MTTKFVEIEVVHLRTDGPPSSLLVNVSEIRVVRPHPTEGGKCQLVFDKGDYLICNAPYVDIKNKLATFIA